MLASGIKAPVPLDELESHLRDDVERRMRVGATAEQAFEAAVQQIGQAGALNHEFTKAGGLRWALLCKVKGIFAGWLVPEPPLATFSKSARETLDLARSEAPRLHHNFVGTEHVLLGLLKLEHGALPNVLKRLNVNREEIRKQIEMWASLFPSMKARSNLPYTPRVKKALRLAAAEAVACHQACTGPEHIFLGLLLEGDGVAWRVLKNLGLDSQRARAEIRRDSDSQLR